MTLATESGELTGTKDKNYDLIRVKSRDVVYDVVV